MTCVKTLEELGREVARDQERSTFQPSMSLKTRTVSNHFEESLKHTGSLVMPVVCSAFSRTLNAIQEPPRHSLLPGPC